MQTSDRTKYPPLVIVGGGNMGLAIVRGGAVGVGPLRHGFVQVVEPNLAKHSAFAEVGVAATAGAGEAMARLVSEEAVSGTIGQILLAVKPQSLTTVAHELQPFLTTERVVITILAGTPTSKVRDALRGRARVVRAMPNLAAAIRQGATALCLGAGAIQGDDRLARAIFEDVGLVATIEESMMDAFTAVAGSGPAYLFYLAEAMLEAATKLGFDEDTACSVVRQTIAGSGKMLAESLETPGTLRTAVTSKGGTTEAALRVMEGRAVKQTIVNAIVAARDRGVELGRPSASSCDA